MRGKQNSVSLSSSNMKLTRVMLSDVGTVNFDDFHDDVFEFDQDRDECRNANETKLICLSGRKLRTGGVIVSFTRSPSGKGGRKCVFVVTSIELMSSGTGV